MTVVSIILTVLLSKGMGAQEVREGMDMLTKHSLNQRECEGANYAQMICKKVKKAFHKHSHKRKKLHVNDSESDSDSDYSL